MLLTLLIFLQVTHAQSKYDGIANDHILESSKKIEIDEKRTQVELQKNAPDYLEYDPPVLKKSQPFIVNSPSKNQDTGIYKDDKKFLAPAGSDPSAQIEQDVESQRELANEQRKSQQEFIEEFKENAAKAGVKVNVDPNTLEVTPEK